METGNAEGAAAAASYAIEVLNFATASGDPSSWRSIVAPTCRMCSAFADDIVSTGPDSSGQLTVEAASGRVVEADGLYAAELTVTQPASPDGKEPAGTFVFQVALTHAEDWVVEAIDVQER